MRWIFHHLSSLTLKCFSCGVLQFVFQSHLIEQNTVYQNLCFYNDVCFFPADGGESTLRGKDGWYSICLHVCFSLPPSSWTFIQFNTLKLLSVAALLATEQLCRRGWGLSALLMRTLKVTGRKKTDVFLIQLQLADFNHNNDLHVTRMFCCPLGDCWLISLCLYIFMFVCVSVALYLYLEREYIYVNQSTNSDIYSDTFGLLLMVILNQKVHK